MKMYSARLIPTNVVGTVRRGDGTATRMRITEGALERGLVDVPLHAGHDLSTTTLGKVSLITRTSWGYEGDVEVFDGADGVTRSSQPLSVGLDVLESYVDDGGVEVVVAARMVEVSCVPVAAFPGAELRTLTRSPEAYAAERERAEARANDARERELIMRGAIPEGYHVIESEGGAIYYPLH